MSAYEIETNVPITTTYKSKYPFEDMEVGNSFYVAGEDMKTIRKLRGAVSWASKRYPDTKYAVRKVDGGVRVWRVA